MRLLHCLLVVPPLLLAVACGDAASPTASPPDGFDDVDLAESDDDPCAPRGPLTTCESGDGCCRIGCDANVDDDCAQSCGNGVVEAGERCDGDCVESCDDGVGCTADVAIGNVADCTRACLSDVIEGCHDGDGCCAAGCAAANDSDCSAACGDHVVQAPETCDGDCPAACDDRDSCTVDLLVGERPGCSAECVATPTSACIGGDGCCPSGCDAAQDDDCGATCGNGVVEPSERCDGDCPTACAPDGDDDACTTNRLEGDGCQARCAVGPLTECGGGDGCCPGGCNFELDGDCPPDPCGERVELCADADHVCGVLTVLDLCGAERELACGECGPGTVCGPSGRAGRCGVEPFPENLAFPGVPVPVRPAMTVEDLQLVLAISPTESWAAGGTTVVHVRGDLVERHAIAPTLGPIRRLYATARDDVWLLGEWTVERYDGTRWSAVTPFTSPTILPIAIAGGSADDIWIAGESKDVTEVRRFDGRAWQTVSSEPRGRHLADLASRAPGVVYRAMYGTHHGTGYNIAYDGFGSNWNDGRVDRWDGTAWVEIRSAIDATRLWVSPSGGLFVFGVVMTNYDDFILKASRFDGEVWRGIDPMPTLNWCSSFDAISDGIDGASDDDVWISGCGEIVRWDGTAITNVPTGPAQSFSHPAADVAVVADRDRILDLSSGQPVPIFSSGTAPGCTEAQLDAAGNAWLVCRQKVVRMPSGSVSLETIAEGVEVLLVRPGTSVWLATSDGRIVRRSAAGVEEPLPAFGDDSPVLSLAGDADDDVWVYTEADQAHHWDGSAWSTHAVGVAAASYGKSALGASGDEVWVRNAEDNDDDPTQIVRRVGDAWVPVALPDRAPTPPCTSSRPCHPRSPQLVVSAGRAWLTVRYGVSNVALYAWTDGAWKLLDDVVDPAGYLSGITSSLSADPAGVTLGVSRPIVWVQSFRQSESAGLVERAWEVERWTDAGATPLVSGPGDGTLWQVFPTATRMIAGGRASGYLSSGAIFALRW